MAIVRSNAQCTLSWWGSTAFSGVAGELNKPKMALAAIASRSPPHAARPVREQGFRTLVTGHPILTSFMIMSGKIRGNFNEASDELKQREVRRLPRAHHPGAPAASDLATSTTSDRNQR